MKNPLGWLLFILFVIVFGYFSYHAGIFAWRAVTMMIGAGVIIWSTFVFIVAYKLGKLAGRNGRV